MKRRSLSSTDGKGSRVVKTRTGLNIEYIRSATIEKIVRQQITLSEWQEKESGRIEKITGTPEWREESGRFRRALLAKKAALLQSELDVEAKQRRVLQEPLPRPFARPVWSITHWKNHLLPPDRIQVFHAHVVDDQVVFDPSNLIYPCPDNGKGEYWSAGFVNNWVELRRYSRYTIEGANFTGRLRISMRERAEGAAFIESGGCVTLSAGAAVWVWRNIGPAEQPQWRQVGYSSMGTAYPHIRTFATGLVSLERASSALSWEFAESRPGDVVETLQYVYVNAMKADVQMGPNRGDCASGNRFGYICTSMPSLDLEYMNKMRRELEEIPRGFSWP